MATNSNIGAATVKIANIMKTRMQKVLTQTRPAVLQVAKDALRRELLVSNFYNLMTRSSDFRGEFGLEDAYYKAHGIIDHVVDGVKVVATHNTANQSLKIDLGKISYSSLLRRPEAKQLNYSKNATSPANANRQGRDKVLTQLPWLKWLLTSGSAIVVHRYKLEKGTIGVGRSGINFQMVRNNRDASGNRIKTREDGYKVSDKYSGYEQNNLLTKSITATQPAVIGTLKKDGIAIIRAAIKAQK